MKKETAFHPGDLRQEVEDLSSYMYRCIDDLQMAVSVLKIIAFMSILAMVALSTIVIVKVL